MTGMRHGGLDALDHRRVGHARDAAVAADVGGHALERHDRDSAGVLGDASLLGRDDVHDHAALEHLGKAAFDPECGAFSHRALRIRKKRAKRWANASRLP